MTPPRSNYEDQLSFAVAEYLDLRGWLYTHFPAGEYRPVKTGAKLKRMGLQRGVPDYLIFEEWEEPPTEAVGLVYGGFGVALELKSPGGTLSRFQRPWVIGLRCRSWSVHVCRTIDEVIAATEVIR